MKIHETLTSRQQLVLRGIFEGLTNKEIGVLVGVSESSVKATLQQLFRKNRVRTRAQLVRIALEGSLLDSGNITMTAGKGPLERR